MSFFTAGILGGRRCKSHNFLSTLHITFLMHIIPFGPRHCCIHFYVQILFWNFDMLLLKWTCILKVLLLYFFQSQCAQCQNLELFEHNVLLFLLFNCFSNNYMTNDTLFFSIVSSLEWLYYICNENSSKYISRRCIILTSVSYSLLKYQFT